jgi:hypothetical protein
MKKLLASFPYNSKLISPSDHMPDGLEEHLKMRTNRWNLALGLGLILAVALACNFNFSTANIGSLKLGKNKDANPETTEFAPNDTVYAVAEISNVPGKVKVKGRAVIDDVPGQEAGKTIPGTEKELDMESSGTATFNYSATGGWPAGKYKVEVTLLTDSGEQKDQKTATFTVK